MTWVRISAGPGEPGRRKKPETTSGSGNGSTCPMALVASVSRKPPLVLSWPSQRPSSVTPKSGPSPVSAVAASNSAVFTCWATSGQRQDLGAALGDQDRVLELGGALAVPGHRRPAVGPDVIADR